MSFVLWIGLMLALLAMVVTSLSAFGARRWARDALILTRRLAAGQPGANVPSTTPVRFSAWELEGLPLPVQRYFRLVLTEGQQFISAANIEMVGTINLSAPAERWKPFRSSQRVTTHRPGFVWNARVSLLPGVVVRVIDSYIAGSGLLHAAILGVLSVAKVSGGGEIARGEFLRYFAEAAWYPTALLPSQGVRWEAVDHLSAKATRVDGLLSVTLLFRFNHAGLIDSVRAEARGAMIGSQIVMMPWECAFTGYEVRAGLTVPISGKVSWDGPAGHSPYFRGTISSLTYEFV